MLYIRADGNTEIGMGHVMRCLSVAEAVADIDSQHPPVFITADEGCRSMIEDRGFQVMVLDTDYRDMMSELLLFEDLFNENHSREKFFDENHLYSNFLYKKHNVILVDSYQVSREYYLALRKYAVVACFEDMGETYPVDLLINYNIYAPDLEQNYKAPEQERHTMNHYPKKTLLGATYMPLRKAFQEPAEYRIADKVTNVIITTGGSDPYFATAAFADALINDKTIAEHGIHLHLISGPFNRFVSELRCKYQRDEVQGHYGTEAAQSHEPSVTVTIHENVKDMRSLLLESDVVITATGSTIYEVSSLGVPMIVFYFAENQRQGAEALQKLTDIVNAGCFAENSQLVADRVLESIKHCIRDKAYRELLSQQEKGLIDGKGAHHIAEQLLRLAAE